MQGIDPVNDLDVDIKLLLALEAVIDERNVTRAAKRVGLSQPAMSNALARLRKLLGDPVLVRTGEGMVPTARAQEIAAPVREALASIRNAIRPKDVFDAAQSSDRFMVASTDYAELLLLPALMRKLHAEAPHVDVAMHPLIACEGYRDLANGKVDVMLGFSVEVPEGLYRQVLVNDRFVCILAKKHPDAKKPLTLERYVSLPHVLISPRGETAGVVDEVIREKGLRRRVALTVPHFSIAPLVVAEGNGIATVPERLAEVAKRTLDLVVLEPPLPLPPFSLTQIWHDRTHQSAAHRWFRQTIASAFTSRPDPKKKRAVNGPAGRGGSDRIAR